MYNKGGFNPRICKRCDFHKPILSFGLLCFNPRICKRCDNMSTFFQNPYKGFNPRICKRCDDTIYSTGHNQQVSIHASVKDATKSKTIIQPCDSSFNPRICKRCDTYICNNCRRNVCFNPRICKRCDIIGPATSAGGTVSIHASVKDATIARFWRLLAPIVSIHASVKDATSNISGSASIGGFQSTHL